MSNKKLSERGQGRDRIKLRVSHKRRGRIRRELQGQRGTKYTLTLLLNPSYARDMSNMNFRFEAPIMDTLSTTVPYLTSTNYAIFYLD